MWFTVALFGYLCLAVVAVLDKFILSKQKVLPSVFVFYSTIFLLPLNLVAFFLPVRPFGIIWFYIVLASSTFAFGLWTMYRAYSKSEVSHMAPFIGGLIPLFILVLGQIFLNELISGKQIIGIMLLSIGTIGISFNKNFNKNWFTGVEWALLSAISFSISHVFSKYIYSSLGFTAGFVYIWGFMGFVGILLLASPTVNNIVFPRKNIFIEILNKFKKHKQPHTQLFFVVGDKILSAVGMVFIQYAVSLGSVTKVYAMSGLQYSFLVLLVITLSLVFPKLFKENYAKGEIKGELIAVFVIAIGLALLV